MSLLLAQMGSTECIEQRPLSAGFRNRLGSSQFDPDVWSGRALQEVFVELAVSGLASMYPAFDLEHLLRAIMDISARAFSLADRPQRAIRVTSVRMRR
jgi:hypothetical protein